MAIQSGDIQLAASQVMDDVPEGGGAPTSVVIVDGTSNSIFNDISELDRALGRVNLRKVFATVRTPDVDGYFGANVIVADPPDDPNVSVSLFSTADTFDTRDSAELRIESYLAQGPLYGGYLYGDHITGQGSVVLLQRTEMPLPVNGDTLVLRKNEGLATQAEQYVRVTKVTSRTRVFTDQNGDFDRTEVTLIISDTLRYDFPGFDAIRFDYSINYANKTKTYTTVVADAARYYGVVPLTQAAAIGDFTLKSQSIYTQIVPSTKIEVPIADARMNQQASALVAAGSPLTQTFNLAFTTIQSMFIGGGILPGSLTISRGGITLTDKGGTLLASGQQVGVIDYSNGVASLTTNVFGTSPGSHTVSYSPATTPVIVSESIGVPVNQQGQRLTYVVSLDPIPSKRTLQVSFRALGSWYVLTEDGSGAIKGSDSSFGAGTLNFTTGTVSVTLGALPDVGSQIIFSWVPAVLARPITAVPSSGPPGAGQAFGKTFKAADPLKPGTITVSWDDGTSVQTATDVNGGLTGAASGAINYADGTIRFQPGHIPAKGTAITVTSTTSVPQTTDVAAMLDGGATWTFNVPGPVRARSFDGAVAISLPLRVFPGTDSTVQRIVRLFDDGAGHLQTASIGANITVGTIDYTTGNCTLNKSSSGYLDNQPVYTTVTVMEDVPSSGGSGSLVQQNPVLKTSQSGFENRNCTITFLNGSSGLTNPPWAWWSGGFGDAVKTRYSGSDGTGKTYNFTLDDIFMPVVTGIVTKFSISNDVGTAYWHVFNQATFEYVRDPSPTTGDGPVVGQTAVVNGEKGVLLTDWPATTGSLLAGAGRNIVGSENPDIGGSTTLMLVDGATFRTAIAPLFNGGFSISYTVNVPGGSGNTTQQTITATPDGSGYFKGEHGVVGRIDYDTGIVTVRFGTPGGSLDVKYLEVPGVDTITPAGAQSDTLRYNAVGYTYLPLDAAILGLDPVRLPSDGRVPIFRAGTVAVVGHTGTIGPATVANGQTVNCGRVRLSRVRVIGNDGAVIDTGYTADLEAGLVTFTNVTGYSQPVKIEHRIEDMALVSNAQINGQMTFTRALTHDYPVPGSYVSSALLAGDMHARVSLSFDQATWDNVWSDDLHGNPAPGTYNTIGHPLIVTNGGALTERWACVFTNTTAFNIVGEHVGTIGTGNTSTDCAPLNPATGEPYFTIHAAGWGIGWAAGNAFRFNTVGAEFPVWVIRTIQQGPATIDNDEFTLLIRGDVDAP
jgi:hypothetical protein